MTFVETLVKFMDREGLSQKALADQLGCSSSTVTRWVHNESRPEKKQVKKMAAIFGVTPTEMWGTNNPPTRRKDKAGESTKRAENRQAAVGRVVAEAAAVGNSPLYEPADTPPPQGLTRDEVEILKIVRRLGCVETLRRIAELPQIRGIEFDRPLTHDRKESPGEGSGPLPVKNNGGR